jgi:hypothetical protein
MWIIWPDDGQATPSGRKAELCHTLNILRGDGVNLRYHLINIYDFVPQALLAS